MTLIHTMEVLLYTHSPNPLIFYKYLTFKKADDWLMGRNSILLTPPIHLNNLLKCRIRREPADLEERRALFDEYPRKKPT
jgi:hypothetical protein